MDHELEAKLNRQFINSMSLEERESFQSQPIRKKNMPAKKVGPAVPPKPKKLPIQVFNFSFILFICFVFIVWPHFLLSSIFVLGLAVSIDFLCLFFAQIP